MPLITKEEFANATGLKKFRMPGLASFLMEVMKITDVNNAVNNAQHLQGTEFIDNILQQLGITVEFNEDELNNLPKNGAFIAIANHPYGGIEGLVLLKLICMVRPDTKLIVNFLLKKISNLSEYFIAVNPFENISHPSSISGIKSTLRLLKNGTPIGIFPAGEVSTYKIKTRTVTDGLWHPVVGKIISKANVPVIPFYFHGNNGLIFNIMNFIHPSLRTAKLPSELFNKQGFTIKVRIGKSIDVQKYSQNEDPTRLLRYLRAKTYALGAGLENEHKLFDSINLFKVRKKPVAVIEETALPLIEAEITRLENFKILAEKNYELYMTSASNIPYILREIGRLREITFREVGEGTNKSIDLDEYDIYYYHLFIWDTLNKLVVGAYRIGKGDEIFYSLGKCGFYLAELFKIKKQMHPILQTSIELGRSWIRKEYQQKPLPLFLLWKGILKYLIENPQYRYLLGPVSISNSFSKMSKSLIVDYIRKNHFDNKLADYVKPRKKFKADLSKMDSDLLIESQTSLKDLNDLISDIETTHRRIPVMLRQYMSLNAKIVCFNIDPKFTDSLDGFLILELKNITGEILERLNKNFS